VFSSLTLLEEINQPQTSQNNPFSFVHFAKGSLLQMQSFQSLCRSFSTLSPALPFAVLPFLSGRGIFATQAVKNGKVLFKEQPFVAAVINKQPPQHLCEWCLQPLQQRKHYCGPECHRRAHRDYLWVSHPASNVGTPFFSLFSPCSSWLSVL